MSETAWLVVRWNSLERSEVPVSVWPTEIEANVEAERLAVDAYSYEGYDVVPVDSHIRSIPAGS